MTPILSRAIEQFVHIRFDLQSEVQACNGKKEIELHCSFRFFFFNQIFFCSVTNYVTETLKCLLKEYQRTPFEENCPSASLIPSSVSVHLYANKIAAIEITKDGRSLYRPTIKCTVSINFSCSRGNIINRG